VAGSIPLEVDVEYPNWFAQSAQYNFDVLLQRFAGQDNLAFLQLGAYTGDASVWMAENILTGSDCLLMDVDTWEGSKELAHEDMDFNEVLNIYNSKVKEFESIISFAMTTHSFLVGGMAQRRQNYFDFIYIDADHTTVGVLLDAELSWPLLKSGGVMAFDDYTWGTDAMDPRIKPKVGIDLFLHRHTGEYEILAINSQVWIEKH
jgi:predicted O-methyltransferase YrrM